MPASIQADTQNIAQLETEFAIMSDMIKTGPLLIGETHTSPAARSGIKDLVSEGNVRTLWLEAPKWRGTPGTQRQVLGFLDNPALGHVNTSTMVGLFDHCTTHFVPVHHWDHQLNFNPAGRAPPGMATRNQFGASLFFNGIGDILLAGSYHFVSHLSGGSPFQRLLNISEPRVFDLSMYS